MLNLIHLPRCSGFSGYSIQRPSELSSETCSDSEWREGVAHKNKALSYLPLRWDVSQCECASVRHELPRPSQPSLSRIAIHGLFSYTSSASEHRGIESQQCSPPFCIPCPFAFSSLFSFIFAAFRVPLHDRSSLFTRIMDDDQEISVYECPWPDKRADVPLEEVAAVSLPSRLLNKSQPTHRSYEMHAEIHRPRGLLPEIA